MPSSLLGKLNRMGVAQGARANPNAAARALVRRASRRPADERLFALAPEALRRIGYAGRAFDPARALFLDTETTGLSGGAGTLAFLVGVGFLDGQDMVVEQYMLTDYSQEAQLLSLVAEKLSRTDTVVHFNGRAFDMPLLQSRFTMARMQNHWRECMQLDLLTPSRRLWKLRLGSCRLSNLEEKILGAPRESDIPGAEIPARFFEFIKTGAVDSMEDVLLHNRQDIFTLETLLCELCQAYGAPEAQTEQMDLFSLGRALEKQGELKRARRLYGIAAAPRPVTNLSGLMGEMCAGRANLCLVRLEKRAGDYGAAEKTLLTMIKRGQLGDIPKLELAKLYEHRLKKLEDALKLTNELLAKCAEEERDALEKRRARIQSKLS